MHRWLLAIVAGCGRIDFDPLADAASGMADAPGVPLVLHYEFDDAPSDGVEDSTGNGHTGTCETTCPTLAAGRVGSGAYLFNGTSDFIATPDAPDLRGPTMSVALWHRRAADSYACLAQKLFGPSYQNSWQLIAEGTRLKICSTTAVDVGTCPVSADNLIATGSWHHLAYVFTGSRHRGYVDGVLVIDLPSDPLVFDGGRLLVGADIDAGMPYGYVDGVVDDLRIYAGVLSDAEIAALASN